MSLKVLYSNDSDGQGTMTYGNGDKYVGEWINDKKHGQGTYTYSNGQIVRGIFANGQFVR